ncbi:MAG: HDOD domain-containing protein [Treponema sp.]|jgi:putative nucleotidyltransferase with HDIG domain|nr:HDOD domain-containing protein [Treponema sp.]
MSSEDRLQTIEKYIINMPSLPTTVSKVLEICNNPNTSPADLNHVISLDPVLVGRVLKLINSAYYALGQQVTSLVRAIIMLGINTVKNLALSTAVLGNFSAKNQYQAINMEGFWRHSLCVGVAAKMIAKKRNVDSKQWEEYFTAGLLHDIGKIPINAVFPQEYVVAISISDRERIPLFLAEDKALEINHCLSGEKIVKAWKLEGAVGDTIQHHHAYIDYDGPHKDVLYSVVAANWFANIMEIGFSGERYIEKIPQQLWEYLNIDKYLFDGIEESVVQEIEKAKVFLKIN